ncbi:hypothetical protein MKW92_041441 [Papaver armeniacum]|nr:hypothetical protein MKW92_041441 [Papaver armeniacum]
MLSEALYTFPDRYSFHINCGGREIIGNDKTKYDADQGADGASKFYQNPSNYWAVSSTGDFQGKLELKDFDIAKAAGGARKAVIKNFTAVVTSNTLEIRFSWAGKGTQRMPTNAHYGPLVSAISVINPDVVPPGKKISVGIVVGLVAASVACLVFLIVAAFWWKGYLGSKNDNHQDLRGLDLDTSSFTLRQIKAATNNFAAENKIGEGGFGPVYKGHLLDGTIIAVKQLSSKSKQGNREFINEIGMISSLQHPNLARLYGCCIEGNQLLLIYEYMENNSLARALFEYVLRGHLTDKADVYSYGVVALEIISGKSNSYMTTETERAYLLDWALTLQENGNLMELVDPTLNSYSEEEVVLGLKIALACTNTSPILRPKMSSVVSMLEGVTSIGKLVLNPRIESNNDLKSKAIADYHEQKSYDQSKADHSETQNISKDVSCSESSTSAVDLYPLIMDSAYCRNKESETTEL